MFRSSTISQLLL
jgi:hypothetical protein